MVEEQIKTHHSNKSHNPRENEDGDLTCTDSVYDDCMYSALERHMIEDSGCVVPWIRSEEKICTDADAVNRTFWIAWNRVTNQV